MKKQKMLSLFMLLLLIGSTLLTTIGGLLASRRRATAVNDGTAVIQPLSLPACQALQMMMEQGLKVAVVQGQARLQDERTGAVGTGCRLLARGTGQELGSVSAVTAVLTSGLSDRKWRADPAPPANDTTSQRVTLRQDHQIAVLEVSWQPTNDANCSAGQPITDCDLTPDQQLYTVTLNAGQESIR